MRTGALALALSLGAALACGCATSLVSGGQLRPEPFRGLVARTELARGIRSEGPVDARVVTRDELHAALRRSLEASWSEQEIRDYEEGLVAVGLWPEGRDLVQEMLAVMTEQVAGVYLPGERAVLIARELPVPFSVRLASFLTRRDLAREFVLTHELVHLLQHQRYPALLDPELDHRGQDDLATAVHAAIEGDALHYGLLALQPSGALPDPEELEESSEENLRATRKGAFAQAPALIRLTLLFPYAHGYPLSLSEGRRLLDAPPASTEQVLHPAKRREPFLAFDLAPLAERLPPECRVVSQNGAGELFLSVLFRDLDPDTPRAVWEGWDGDRYLAAACGGRREILWRTAWDSRSDALEFAEAYAAHAPTLAERGGLSGTPAVQREEREVWIASPGLVGLLDALPDLPRRRVATVAELLPPQE
jgi:hypothetical protein